MPGYGKGFYLGTKEIGCIDKDDSAVEKNTCKDDFTKEVT